MHSLSVHTVVKAASQAIASRGRRKKSGVCLDTPSGGEGTAMTDFFISYTHVDRPWAEWIAWQLEAAGDTTVIQA
jgi:hypothetical protein